MPGGAQRSIRINPALSAVTNLMVVIGPLVGSAITSVFSTKAVFLFGAACALLGLVPASALVAASSLAGMVVFRKRVDRAVEEERLLGTNQGSRR